VDYKDRKMKKLVFTAAVALVLATGGAYAQHHGGGGGGGGGGMGGGGGVSAGAAGGFRGGGGGAGLGAGANFNARTGGPSMGARTMGPSGPTRGLYNSTRSPSGTASFGRHGPNGVTGRTSQRNFANSNRRNFASGNQRRTFNYAGPNRGRELTQGGNRNGAAFRRGLASGNFFEHGRRFRFRRFWNGQWVFLNDWSGCTAWVWIHVAPGIWAWRPINVCIG
jgi:hypothetical protein